MKTIESVLKSIKKNSQRCHICDLKEGDLHPLNGITIKIKKDEKSGFNYCQSCLKTKTEQPKKQKKKQMLKIIEKFCFVLLLGIGSSTALMGQPGLPTAPDQAPIDGGLGILATLGGVYAWKKLKKKTDL